MSVFCIDQATSGLERVLDMAANAIGQPSATITITPHTAVSSTATITIPDHTAAARLLMERLAHMVPLESIVSIGHRLVHGGPKYAHPMRVADILQVDWEQLCRLDPQHTPAAKQLIDRIADIHPRTPQIACFDTAFFHDLPRAAQVIPIPHKYFAQGVRKYGFHGLSYTSLLDSFRDIAGETAVNGRVILAHLGSGASLAATRGGGPVDTTMSLTPASGIAMSVRSGDLDPNIFSFLHHQNGMSSDEFSRMVNFESGLLGISERTGDIHDLLDLEVEDASTALAIEVFVRDVKKAIGALSATIGGLDSLIFSGGIGERSATLRGRICQDLEYLGITIDETANKQHATLISAAGSRAGVHVIPTDEARVIATQTYELLTSRES